MTDRFEELDALLIEWEDGTLNDAGIGRLREILREDPAAQEHFAKMQALSAAMHIDGTSGVTAVSGTALVAEGSTESTPIPPSHLDQHPPLPGASVRPLTTARRSTPRRVVQAALLLVACGLISRLAYLESNRTPRTVAESTEPWKEGTSRGIAIVTRLVGAGWTDGASRLRVGQALEPGTITLDSGFAQIEFFCGATVVIEGPAELALETSELATVRSGRLRAQVPPAARGFSLKVDDMTVVDLGTEFGLAVSDEGARVEVFDGEVELHATDSATKNLKQGQGVHRKTDGSFTDTEAAPNTFVDIDTLESRANGVRTARYDRWKAWSDALREDNRLVTYFAFANDEVRARRLVSSTTNTELDGAIVGARATTGRWQQKTALEFKRPADRVRVQIPGEFSSLTFSAWVRIDSLDRKFNSLFLTDNYNLGEPHWQILDTGQLYFSVRPSPRNKPGPRDFKALSKPFWNPSLSGRWLHVATVYDVKSRQIAHYLDGELLSQATVPREQIVEQTRIGTASIGNWAAPTQPDEAFAIRNLNGRIDEFALFRTALTADEIQEIYEIGRP